MDPSSRKGRDALNYSIQVIPITVKRYVFDRMVNDQLYIELTIFPKAGNYSQDEAGYVVLLWYHI